MPSRHKLATMIATTIAVLAAAPGTAHADGTDGAAYGEHVVTCAQTVGFDGVHNPGMHDGFSGWDPSHQC